MGQVYWVPTGPCFRHSYNTLNSWLSILAEDQNLQLKRAEGGAKQGDAGGLSKLGYKLIQLRSQCHPLLHSQLLKEYEGNEMKEEDMCQESQAEDAGA